MFNSDYLNISFSALHFYRNML